MIIDAENQVLGRVAALAAKNALMEEKVDIVNCEKAIITGKKQTTLAHYKRRVAMGVPKKGPYVHRNPDRFVRRAVRGMLPYKKPRGAEAFKRIMCHIGVPDDFKSKDTAKVPSADVSKLTNLKYITVKDVCKELGAKL